MMLQNVNTLATELNSYTTDPHGDVSWWEALESAVVHFKSTHGERKPNEIVTGVTVTRLTSASLTNQVRGTK
jgi:hypothetical protein